MADEVEIVAGWDGHHRFAVHTWSASGDSGQLIETFETRRDAVCFARRFAREHDMQLHFAPVVPLERGRA